MPRLVLYDDDARVLFDGQVSQANVEIVGGFLRRNMGALRAAAAFKKSLDSLGELLGLASSAAPPARRPPPLRPAARARGPRR